MRILAIRGKNLASLKGEFEIDFRSEPLNSAGLFAITGSTGSGKTTILDAMCIALYGRTPRLDNIKNSTAIEVHGAKSVSEDDVKTILRRGTYEGYAEVDFSAVDGNEYRVRWSVSRVSKNPNGNFRPISYDLTNISCDEHQILQVNRHKELIPLLTGLTFEQFTRAVLLAQGNFAAFLKADENEKAQILQTLTGTEIYSRISELIYKRSEEVKKELDAIEEKKRGISIMTAEELATVNEHKQKLLERQESTNKELHTLIEKKKWLEYSLQLSDKLRIAVEEHNLAVKALDDATPKIERLALIDSVQEMRDSYTSLCNAERACETGTKEIEELTKKLDVHNKELSVANEAVTKATKEQEKVNKEWLTIQPLIMQAVKLEEQIEIESKREKEVDKEKKQFEKELSTNCLESKKAEENISKLKLEQQSISEWFEKYKEYEEVVPYIPSIIINIVSAGNEKKSATEKRKQLEIAEKQLALSIKRREEALKRAEELEHTLSSEIALLREKLVEGEPCPVCGSRHHEVIEDVLNILGEKELEKEKSDIKQQLEYLEKSIEDGKVEIAGLRSAIELHSSAEQDLIKRSAELMESVPNPYDILAKKDVTTFLKDIHTGWEEKKIREAKINEELSANNTALGIISKRNRELERDIATKGVLLDEIKSNLEKGRADIKNILGESASTKEIQERYNNLIADANKSVTDTMEKKVAIADLCNNLNGQLSEKKKSLAENNTRCTELHETINALLAKRDDGMTFMRLKEILSVEQSAIVSLRDEIDKLNKAVTATLAAKNERIRNIEEHNRATVKPGENDDAQILQTSIEEINSLGKTIIEELGNINATLIKDEENNRLFAKFKEEYERKREIATNWNTLNVMFGSAKGEKLMRLAQGYTLEILLDVANIHLKEITGRYELARISDRSLGIKVIDLDMLSESRSVHSLSGGETFLVSLALSLALSSISSNRMSVESLFIDEGFGALDSTTLKTAMHALEHLQSQGRKIGVISHLGEMLEQIPVKINVIKKNSGKSRIEITES